MPQSFACLHNHIIFSTKNREPLLVGDVPDRLYAYIAGILRNEHGSLVIAGGTPDHVHLLAAISRESSMSDLLRQIKGSSSRLDQRNVSASRRIRVASGVRCIRRELFPRAECQAVHSHPGRTSPDSHVPG